MKVGAIILARLDSARLPGKQLRDFAGKPLLDWLLVRCDAAGDSLDATVLATSDRPVDDPLADFADARGLACFRGSADDVAARILGAAEAHELTHFFRMNGDSPCVLPELLRAARERVAGEPALDFVTNLRPRTFPYGVACELFRTDSFRAGCARMTDPRHREHVTLYFYEHASVFRFASLVHDGAPLDHLRLTVDTAEDARFFERFLSRAGARWPQWTLADMAAAAVELQAPAA